MKASRHGADERRFSRGSKPSTIRTVFECRTQLARGPSPLLVLVLLLVLLVLDSWCWTAALPPAQMSGSKPAGGRAKSKLQRLLRDLDLGDSSSALPAYHDESVDGEESRTVDHSSEAGESVQSVEPQQLIMQAHASSDRYIQMERRAIQLMHENKVLQATYQQHVKMADMEMAEMRAQLKGVLQEMEQRQKEVEAKAPIMQTRLEDYRGRLHDLRISEAQYQELKSMPQAGLHILDQVKVRAAGRVGDEGG
jgi:hypothetical protein